VTTAYKLVVSRRLSRDHHSLFTIWQVVDEIISLILITWCYLVWAQFKFKGGLCTTNLHVL